MAKARQNALVLTAALVISSCSWQGPSLAGHPGLQYQVTSFYDDHAMERDFDLPESENAGYYRI